MGGSAETRDPELEALLASVEGPRARWLWILLGTLLAALAAVLLVVWWRGEGDAVRYLTEPVRRGDLTVLVTATGALEPTDQVDVGTEISGTIETVLVDFNDTVRAGQVLARLDVERLQAAVAQSQAAVSSARARLAEAEATAEEAGLRLQRLERASALSEGRVVSEEELTVARAAMARADAGIATARAAIAEAEARLSSEAANLEKAIIRAPIDGIVLTRQVEPGQTVVASLQTPVLFTLAETLARMQLNVAVDEADVGQVAPGQLATFTVAAYPEREFPAVIEAVHYAPTTTAEGVVTYEAVLAVDNHDQSLRPGMTATADIVVERREDVLLVPGAALRFEPPAAEEEAPMSLTPRPPVRFARSARDDAVTRVWTLEQGEPSPVEVVVGASDGTVTEILAGPLREGQPVVVDYQSQASP